MSFIRRLFGGGSSNQVQPQQIQYNPSGFSSPGINASVSGGGVNVGQSPGLSSAVGNLSSTFGNEASAFEGLLKTVQPGFSQFRRAGLQDIANQGKASASNLRDTLTQRRVLGSSFANASISQNAADTEKARTDFIANSYLSELQASQQLIQQQYQAATQQFSVGINQSNFEAGIAAQLTSSNNQINSQIADANARLTQQSAEFNAQQQANADQGIGKLFGTIFSAGTNSVGGTALSSLGKGIGDTLGRALPIFALG